MDSCIKSYRDSVTLKTTEPTVIKYLVVAELVGAAVSAVFPL